MRDSRGSDHICKQVPKRNTTRETLGNGAIRQDNIMLSKARLIEVWLSGKSFSGKGWVSGPRLSEVSRSKAGLSNVGE